MKNCLISLGNTIYDHPRALEASYKLEHNIHTVKGLPGGSCVYASINSLKLDG